MPTKVLHNNSPFQILYKHNPDYSHLRVFGSLCFPWQPSSQRNKLEPRAPACVFLGYSGIHKGYFCLNPITNRLIVSRHVKFHEDQLGLPPAPSTNSTSSVLPTPPLSLTPPPFLLSPSSISYPPHQPLPPPTLLPRPSIPTYSSPAPSPPSNSLPPLLPKPTTPAPRLHPMKTRLQTGSWHPKPILDLTTTPSSLNEPSSATQALKLPEWRAAMLQELTALHNQETWTLTSPPTDHPILGSKWTFRIKQAPDGSVIHKARLVAQGYDQIPGLQYSETFSPVAKMATIRLLLTVALHRKWSLRQLDVSNAFLHGSLTETVYIRQPPGFPDPTNPTAVCKLNKALYGLKQSPQQWYSALTANLKSQGFQITSADPSLLYICTARYQIYIAVYVDDLLIATSDVSALHYVIQTLGAQFNLKPLSHPTVFLGIHIKTEATGLFLSQGPYYRKYFP